MLSPDGTGSASGAPLTGSHTTAAECAPRGALGAAGLVRSAAAGMGCGARMGWVRIQGKEGYGRGAG